MDKEFEKTTASYGLAGLKTVSCPEVRKQATGIFKASLGACYGDGQRPASVLVIDKGRGQPQCMLWRWAGVSGPCPSVLGAEKVEVSRDFMAMVLYFVLNNLYSIWKQSKLRAWDPFHLSQSKMPNFRSILPPSLKH